MLRCQSVRSCDTHVRRFRNQHNKQKDQHETPAPRSRSAALHHRGLRGERQQPRRAASPLPNYTGVWSGGYTVTNCTQNGDLALANICGTFSPGASAGFQLNIIQQGTAITAGNFTMGTVPFNVVPAPLTSSAGWSSQAAAYRTALPSLSRSASPHR